MIKYFGIIQGRLIKSETGELQSIPINWDDELQIAKNIKLNYIEFIAEKKFNKKSPLWKKKKLKFYKKIIKKNKLKIYSLCDDFSLTNSFWKKKFFNYFDKMLKTLTFLGIKVYTLPLYEKSNITNLQSDIYIKSLSLISKKLHSKNILFCIESNLPKKFLKDLFKKIKSKNLYITFDTGNRIINNDIYSDIDFLNKKIAHIHLKDKNTYDKNVRYGTGLINFERFFKKLKKN